MGQSTSKQNIPENTFTPEVEVIVKKQASSQLGEIKHVRDIHTHQEMALKRFISQDENAHNHVLAYYHNRYTNRHPNLINVVGYTSEKQASFCSENHVVNVYFDAITRNLQAEYEDHVARGELFSEVELQLLSDHMISILSQFQRKDIAHREINLINIYVTEEAYKICDPTLTGQKAANGLIMYALLGVKSYLAPELLKQIPAQDYEIKTNQFKADVFSLGATILSLATLSRSEDLYDFENGRIDLNLLESRIRKAESIYSPTFTTLLRELLIVDEKLRPDFLRLDDRLHIGETIKAYNDNVHTPSYASVPYVKIAKDPLREHSEVSSPAIADIYSSTFSHQEPAFRQSVHYTPSKETSPQFSNNSPLYQSASGAKNVPAVNYHY